MLVGFAATVSGFFLHSLTAYAAIDNTAYGILAFSQDQYKLTNNVVTFDLVSDTEPVFQTAVGFSRTSTAGAYGGKFYYIATSETAAQGEIPKSLVRVDLNTGSTAEVGDLKGFNSFINDMTYDWSTSTMYAVAKLDNNVSALYTIDLSTASTSRVATLDRRFFTLAASYMGELYGISYAGEFCGIDKKSGKVTVIGHTGQLPQNFQSMEFDHAERKLYWIASTHIFNESGTIEVPESFVATVNLKDGSINRLQNFGDNQLVGLYIPSFAAADNCPAPVTAPGVRPGDNGQSVATIEWINPSTTFAGEPLKSITKVDILRDGKTVGTISDADPGKKSVYTDNIAETNGAVHEWQIIPYNINGAGAPVSISAFIGKDIPSPVRNLTVKKTSPNSAVISWDPVTEGVNGGWTDSSTMKYDMVRNPGEEKVASGLTETVWDETGVDVSGTYTYSVTAANSCGISEPVVSAPVTLGPKLGVPYTCEFEDDFGQWSPVDANNDENTWIRSQIAWAKADGAYFMSANEPGDDWLISNTFELEPNSSYKVRLNCFANGTHPVDFYLLQNSDYNSPIQKIQALELTRTFQLGWIEFQFSTGENIGDCNIAIHNRAEKGNSYMIIDRMEIEKLADNNLAAISIRGNDKPVEGNTYAYTVNVTNKGSRTYESFTIELLDQEGTILTDLQVTEPLAPAESRDYSIDYSFPIKRGITGISARVKAEGDEIAEDNQTELMALTLLPVGSPEEVALGVKKSTSYYHPLNLYNKYGASLNIYDASEVGVKRGRITSIKLNCNVPSYSSDAPNVGVKVYLADTERTKAADGWIPEEEMTLVYDGTLDIVKGDNIYEIPFSRAYDYEGKNLAVLTVTSLENSGVTYLYASQPYYTSPIAGNNVVTYGGNTPFDFMASPRTQTGNSVITLMVQSGGASISGTVRDKSGAPVADAEVTIVELNAITLTDAEGHYNFDFVPNATYSLKAHKFGYEDIDPKTLVIEDNDGTADFTIEQLPTFSVKGKVTDVSGNPLKDVEITLNGYTGLNTVSDDNGSFAFSNVVKYPETSVTLAKAWYIEDKLTFDLDSDKDLGAMKLTYAHYAPANPISEADGGKMILNWESPSESTVLRYDSGMPSTQLGFSTAIGTAVIGSVFREPMTLKGVSWFTTEEGGPHNTVNLYIYDLDRNGDPTGDILYSERSIFNNDNEWTSYELPASVEAPNGCFVSINYPGFHGIGLDDNPRSWPVQENVYAFSTEFSSGEFMYFDSKSLDGNLMIRAEGDVYSSEGAVKPADEAPDFWKYQVWRSNGYDNEEWTLLTPEPVTGSQFEDNGWAMLPSGVYRYAVATVLPDGTLSEKASTCYVPKNMNGNITLQIVTNSHSGNAEGAEVSLVSKSNGTETKAIVKKGKPIRFEDMWRDLYSLSVTLPGYTFEPIDIDLRKDDDVLLDEVILKEIIATPVNVMIKANGENDYLMTWNESGEISEDFESHVPFTQASAGEFGWNYIDGDGARTFAEADFEFPGRTQPGSFMVFNPWLTTPSMADLRSASLPHSGRQELACFAGYTGSNDWFITPRLTYHDKFRFSFWARGYSQTYGEVIRVLYSATDMRPESFRGVSDEIEVAKQVWTKYEFEIPADARYVAINSISPDGFTLFIDDVEISSGNGFAANTVPSGPEVKYEISVDGKVVGQTEGSSYELKNIPADEHEALIKAVYASGSSAPASVTFGESGIGSVYDSPLSIFPNPATTYTEVNGEFELAILYDLQGNMLRKYDNGDSRLDLTDVPRGFYLLVVKSAAGLPATFKLTVK